jgi:hypothetical protein
MTDKTERPRMTDSEKELAKHFRNWMHSPMSSTCLERFMHAMVTHELHARIVKATT